MGRFPRALALAGRPPWTKPGGQGEENTGARERAPGELEALTRPCTVYDSWALWRDPTCTVVSQPVRVDASRPVRSDDPASSAHPVI